MDLSADEAVLMLAALACSSDGQLDPTEEATVRRRLAAPLRRLGVAGEDRAFTRLYAMMGQKGQDWTLTQIRQALPRLDDRLEAVRTAVEIVRSDGSMTSEEMDYVAGMADGLGLSRAQLRAAMGP